MKVNLRNVPNAIAARLDFNCNGTLKGSNGGHPLSGRLPLEYLKEFSRATSAPDFYVVTSYATPIAWYAEGIWYVPDVKYSVTTSRHQSRLYLVSNRMNGEGWAA